MLTKKEILKKIEDANKIFVVTVEKLKKVKTEILTQITSNKSGIERLASENKELETMASQTTRQIEEIGKFIG